MKQLQDKVFAQTEKLIAQFSIWRVIFLFALSTGLLFVLLWALGVTFDLLTISVVVGLSLIYSFSRDVFMTKYTKKVMYSYYEYMIEKKPKIELYIPIFVKTGQGFILKKAALYIDKGKLYMEAYNQNKRGNKPSESITIDTGINFQIDAYYFKKDERFVTYKADLMATHYEFSVVNIQELIDLIEQKKGVN